MALGDSEWISVGDLMSGIVAVVVLLFAVAALRGAVAEEATRQMAAEQRRREDEHTRLLASLREKVEAERLDPYIQVDELSRVVTLKSATFRSGDACIDAGQAAIESIRPAARAFLEENAGSRILVEGHSDANPVRRTLASRCGIFDDNYALSALRAREARRLLIEGWPEELADRTGVAGYGPSQPIEADRLASANRRVEIRFVPGALEGPAVGEPRPAADL